VHVDRLAESAGTIKSARSRILAPRASAIRDSHQRIKAITSERESMSRILNSTRSARVKRRFPQNPAARILARHPAKGKHPLAGSPDPDSSPRATLATLPPIGRIDLSPIERGKMTGGSYRRMPRQIKKVEGEARHTTEDTRTDVPRCRKRWEHLLLPRTRRESTRYISLCRAHSPAAAFSTAARSSWSTSDQPTSWRDGTPRYVDVDQQRNGRKGKRS